MTDSNDDWEYLCHNNHYGGQYGCDLCADEGKALKDKDNTNMEKCWLNDKGYYDYKLHKKWIREKKREEEIIEKKKVKKRKLIIVK